MNKTQSLILAIILSLCWLPSQSTHATEKAPKANKIRQVSPGVYHIPESEVLRLLGSMAFLSKQARLRRVFRNKVVAGYRIYKIKKDSVFTRAGLKNKDLLTHINDIPLNSPKQKTQLLNLLNKTKKFKLRLSRKGKALVLTYILENPKPPPAKKPKTSSKNNKP